MALKLAAALGSLAACEAFSLGVAPALVATVRSAPAIFMDETIVEKALAGELEEEGFENIFLSELGWADYLDKNAKSSYNMNERPSLAADGYYTASILDSPGQGEPLHCTYHASAQRRRSPRGMPRGGVRPGACPEAAFAQGHAQRRRSPRGMPRCAMTTWLGVTQRLAHVLLVMASAGARAAHQPSRIPCLLR
jgi:hypothetical protein